MTRSAVAAARPPVDPVRPVLTLQHLQLIAIVVGFALQWAGFAYYLGQRDTRLDAVEAATAPLQSGLLARLDERTTRILDQQKQTFDQLARLERRP